MKNLLIALDEADAFCRVKNCQRVLDQCLFYTNPSGLDGRTNVNEKEQNEMEGKKGKTKKNKLENVENSGNSVRTGRPSGPL